MGPRCADNARGLPAMGPRCADNARGLPAVSKRERHFLPQRAQARERRFLSRPAQARRYDKSVRTIERWGKSAAMAMPPEYDLNGLPHREGGELENWERSRITKI